MRLLLLSSSLEKQKPIGKGELERGGSSKAVVVRATWPFGFFFYYFQGSPSLDWESVVSLGVKGGGKGEGRWIEGGGYPGHGLKFN